MSQANSLRLRRRLLILSDASAAAHKVQAFVQLAVHDTSRKQEKAEESRRKQKKAEEIRRKRKELSFDAQGGLHALHSAKRNPMQHLNEAHVRMSDGTCPAHAAALLVAPRPTTTTARSGRCTAAGQSCLCRHTRVVRLQHRSGTLGNRVGYS